MLRNKDSRPHFGILIRRSIFFLMEFMLYITYKDDIQIVSQFAFLLFHPVEDKIQR